MGRVTVFVVGALLAASCGGSGAADEVRPDTTGSTTTSVAPPAEPGEPPAPATDVRGVTDDTVSVGVVAVDWQQLADMGIDFNQGDVAAIYNAALEGINDRGGAGGRRLEITTETFLPVGGTEADDVCVRLTEDEEVFVVVGEIRLDEVLCYTELHETAALPVRHQSRSRIDRSKAPYVTLEVGFDEAARQLVGQAVSAGLLEDTKVGVLGFADVDEFIFDATVAALRLEGFEPVLGLVGPSDGDVAANTASQDTVLERFRTEGVEVTIHAGSVALGLANAERAGYETTWMQIPYLEPSALDAGGVGFDYLDGAISVAPNAIGTTSQAAMAGDPAVAACVETIEAGTDETVDFSLLPETENLLATVSACGLATILELALDAAGPELTNDTFGAALAGLHEFELPGFGSSFLGPDDFAAAVDGSLVRFSAADGGWVEAS